ncbi:MAG: outer membrane beta-barrel protein [Gemmatimonadetes bacterium]|nr:outer membrane beta-barrel protein [Gemmatimonadota bacterium]
MLASTVFLAGHLIMPQPVAAQDFLFHGPVVNLSFRGGFNFARAGSELFDFTTEQLTLDKSDFSAGAFGADLGVQVNDRVDVFASFAWMSARRSSEFREYLDQDDLPITQRTRFSQTPLTLGIRYYLAPRGRSVGRFVWIPERVVPYVGLAAGGLYYEFAQHGSWVDQLDEELPIFDDRFETDGFAPIVQGLAGLDYTLATRVVLNTEARLTYGAGDVDGDYIGFDSLDLSGLQITMGLKFRF